MSEYERQRLQNIRQNAEILKSLGLAGPRFTEDPPRTGSDSASIDDDQLAQIPRKKLRYTGSKVKPRPSAAVATAGIQSAIVRRRSQRLRGEKPSIDVVQATAILDAAAEAPRPTSSAYQRAFSGKKQNLDPTQATLQLSETIYAPLTLVSIGTTILEIGRICMYHHPYPVGYKAQKRHFDRLFCMEIEKGEHGPIFIVSTENGNRRWSGDTPTKPWTKVCIALCNNKTRISGPLFFGFSDPITQRMIERLEGYQTWKQTVAMSESETGNGQMQQK
ncbi:hypothetical protein EV182_002595 [Spiromyces aspiralis]|uniref:Uncharacterized protein n=1 Tax=Spiromyces aspiralis TaxID=68401 RepID=A0ACC1HHG3_9FUNG|nr:hypothetical protein EV182_002595 [Spiromyces aspiralis]